MSPSRDAVRDGDLPYDFAHLDDDQLLESEDRNVVHLLGKVALLFERSVAVLCAAVSQLRCGSVAGSGAADRVARLRDLRERRLQGPAAGADPTGSHDLHDHEVCRALPLSSTS